jgi:CelD/BcsL family acetyltransferase involved in cellulose biosynthesis
VRARGVSHAYSRGVPVTAEIFDDARRLEPLRESWDALAVAAGRPFCAPGWALAWWRHASPKAAALRVVAVRDGGELVGIAPLWADSDESRGARYRLLAGRLSAPVGPLAAEGREREVAAATAEALAAASPRPWAIVFEGQPVDRDWAGELAGAWPGRGPWRHATPPVASPTVDLSPADYESWLATKTGNFRQQARRFRRRLDKEGATFRVAGPGEIERAVSAFVDLHGARWSERGGSNALVDGLAPMLLDAAGELAPLGRFRAVTIEIDGTVVSAQLLVAAGGEVSYWNGGFDERWERHKPAQQTLLFAIADAIERGDRRIDLGPGAQDYKRRLADGEDAVDTVTVVPRGTAYPLGRARLAPYQARWAVSRRLTPDVKRRLRGLLRR